MELTEFEGMPPLQHFCYNGKAGSASVLTFDASLSPAVTTVSSLVFRLGPKNNPPAGLADRLGDFPDPPICNANGEKFFRTDKKALDLTGSFDAFGCDFVQSSALESSVVNLQRYDHILSFDDAMQARFVFSSKLGEHATEYTCFQPFVKHFGNDLTVYAYLPLGRHSLAHFVVKEKASGHSKVLSLSLKLYESVGHLNHWSFFVKELDEAEEEDATTSFQTAKFIFTNLYLSNDGALNLFYAEENFSLPQGLLRLLRVLCGDAHVAALWWLLLPCFLLLRPPQCKGLRDCDWKGSPVSRRFAREGKGLPLFGRTDGVEHGAFADSPKEYHEQLRSRGLL